MNMAWRIYPGHIFLEAAVMYLPAITIGYAVPYGNFDATVHSVFQSAINLRPSIGSELLTLVTSSEADLPQGIRVDTPKNFSFEIFYTGEKATCQDGNLYLDSLAVELRGARRWKCDLPAQKADMTDPAVATAWKSAWQILSSRQGCSGLEIITEDLIFSDDIVRFGMLQEVEEAIRDLVDATRLYNLTVTNAVGKLIGLGAGLTPSCDDLLVGYLAGLWCTVQGRSERVQFISDLGKEILRLSLHTNDISRTYLYHATRGQVSSLLAALAGSICQGESSDSLIKIAEAAMRVGHISGMVAVAGLLLGLAVWNGDHLLKDTNKTELQFSLMRALL
jgi:hypothetical protein